MLLATYSLSFYHYVVQYIVMYVIVHSIDCRLLVILMVKMWLLVRWEYRRPDCGAVAGQQPAKESGGETVKSQLWSNCGCYTNISSIVTTLHRPVNKQHHTSSSAIQTPHFRPHLIYRQIFRNKIFTRDEEIRQN